MYFLFEIAVIIIGFWFGCWMLYLSLLAFSALFGSKPKTSRAVKWYQYEGII